MPVACERSANESRKSGSDFTEIGVGLQLPTSAIPEAHWLTLHPPDSTIPLHNHQSLASNKWRKKF
eukprot:1161783-Pelagomonas_calceolata.AAC.3